MPNAYLATLDLDNWKISYYSILPRLPIDTNNLPTITMGAFDS